ncbi:cytosolic phospholipase A2 delta-like [Ambystoma mexicanum]|uniref:cytosolic phospholipase A2 delta-like n=1 Tax=Ambystoma mexicanum TaxID=8296 RepID=UPI0037E94C7F
MGLEQQEREKEKGLRNVGCASSHTRHGAPNGLIKNVFDIHSECAETILSSLLTIKVLQAKNIGSGDMVTHADCYVRLWIPSATDRIFVTKTVSNTDVPFWGETFEFKIYNRIKNILHLSLIDEDVITKDDHLYTIYFDVGKLPFEETIVKSFALNQEGNEELELEFRRTKISESPENIITNGVLVSRELSCLEVNIDKQKSAKVFKDNEELVLTVTASCTKKKTSTLSSDSTPVDNFLFHTVKNWDPELTATLDESKFPAVTIGRDDVDNGGHDNMLTLPLNLLPLGEKVNVALHTEMDKKLEFEVKVNDCPEHLDMRLGFDLCQEEKDYLQKRKVFVARALKAALGLSRDLQEHEVPVIAVSATGGGARAMTSLYGTLSGLRKMNLLDTVSYITGASGSTWCMSKLYEDADWSKTDLARPIEDARKHMVESKTSAFSWDRLKYYYNEMEERSKEGHPGSFTDLWGLVIESMFYDRRYEGTLSDQQQAVNQGQNPLPLYLAMNVKDVEKSTLEFKEWCEFSPYEVGLIKYGAFIRSQHFDSEFFMGRVMKPLKESRICYLQGLWSNVFSVNLLDAWFAATNSENFWSEWTREPLSEIDDDEMMLKKRPASLSTRVLASSGMLSDTLRGVLTNRPLAGENHNFLNGFQIHEKYHKTKAFSAWKDTELDLFPDQLTPSSDKLCLVDSAYYINASFPPLLREERKVDIILSFDYGLGDKFKSVEETCNYCNKQGIEFPKVSLKDEDKESPKECYVFAKPEDTNAPIVLHFPLVNDTFKQYKAPGLERTPEEMEDGNVPLCGKGSPYRLLNMTYDEPAFNKLVNLNEYNVMNSQDAILEAFRLVMDRKASVRT